MKNLIIVVLVFVQCLLGIFADVPTTPDNICLQNPPALNAQQVSAPLSNCDSSSKNGKHPDQDLKTVIIIKFNNSLFACQF